MLTYFTCPSEQNIFTDFRKEEPVSNSRLDKFLHGGGLTNKTQYYYQTLKCLYELLSLHVLVLPSNSILTFFSMNLPFIFQSQSNLFDNFIILKSIIYH